MYLYRMLILKGHFHNHQSMVWPSQGPFEVKTLKVKKKSKFICYDSLISDQGVLSESESASLARKRALAVTLSATLAQCFRAGHGDTLTPTSLP